MAKFKKGDRITNGKIEYTVLDITNLFGEACYTFKHPIKKATFVLLASQVDKSFVLVEEDYKKEYEEALERMKSWAKGEHPECFTEAQKAAEFVFPELKENEDEKIRKEIMDYLKGFIPHHDDDLVAKSKVWIAWLENLKI